MLQLGWKSKLEDWLRYNVYVDSNPPSYLVKKSEKIPNNEKLHYVFLARFSACCNDPPKHGIHSFIWHSGFDEYKWWGKFNGFINNFKKVSNSSPQNIITPLFKGSKIAFTGDETTNTFAEPQSACKGYQGKIQVTCEGPEVDASPPIKQLDYVLNCSSCKLNFSRKIPFTLCWILDIGKILNIQTQKVVAEYCCVQYFAIVSLALAFKVQR